MEDGRGKKGGLGGPAGGRDRAVLQAAKHLATQFGRPRSLRNACLGEIALSRIQMDMMRRRGPIVLAEGFEDKQEETSEPKPPAPVPPPPAYSPEEQATWLRYLDAQEADLLRGYTRLILASDRPRPERLKVIDELRAGDAPLDSNLVTSYRRAVLPMASSIDTAILRARLKAQILSAGADLLLYHRKTGRFPDCLEQAVPGVPTDPFTRKPLTYRKQGKGFLLHSPGTDNPNEPNPRTAVAEFLYPLPRPASAAAPKRGTEGRHTGR